MLYLYFCRGPGVTRRQKLIVWLIRRIARQEWTHVCIGDAAYTVNLRPEGDRAYPTDYFIRTAPGLKWMVIVPTPLSTRVDILGPSPWWPAVIRWAIGPLGFLIPVNDCVQKARRVLSAHGVSTPPLTTPAALWDWARLQGFEMLDLSGECHVRDEYAAQAGRLPS